MWCSLPDGGVGELPGQGLGGDRGEVAEVGYGGDQARGDKRKKVLWLPLIGSLLDFGTTTIFSGEHYVLRSNNVVQFSEILFRCASIS